MGLKMTSRRRRRGRSIVIILQCSSNDGATSAIYKEFLRRRLWTTLCALRDGNTSAKSRKTRGFVNYIDPSRRYRTIWISDIHLGTRGCKADFLLDFLKHNESEYLYLVGDIVDGWRLSRSWYWAQSHNDVVQKLLRKARKGTQVFYIPGNHDEWLRDYVELQMGGVMLVDEAIHETADGKRLLVMHGDAFDGVVRYARWVALLGDWAYDNVLRLNHYYNVIRRRLGYPYWSLSAYLKNKVKNAVEYISNYADAIAAEARRREVHGI